MYSKIMMLFICIAWYVLQCQGFDRKPNESQKALIRGKVVSMFRALNYLRHEDAKTIADQVQAETGAIGYFLSRNEFETLCEDRQYSKIDCIWIVRFIVGDDREKEYAETLFLRNGHTNGINFNQLSFITHEIRGRVHKETSLDRKSQLKLDLTAYTYPIGTIDDAIRTITRTFSFAVL
ncbi:uncharacterized protein LOC126839951 isoform X3 [Adelges cooleyi]|uniref:uncharacterized protein LOC126837666 n=1 Tax=Adelges cooleyi TaxID=133065 RepID=UPI00217F59EF|nr:uncharacterized protein LOC126837666 [Adelges cooleyi]XP_050431381.1 uncharacterized protein LOC126839951 isoform X3 [Adelges cooleyi]XP_050431384.1 uncharacterized protein LOC126839951 isoform X3 [Adelges cooleyi]